jgi:hypothetical protein
MNPAPSIKSCLNEGCTGTKPRSLLNEMRRGKQKYGVVIRRSADAWGQGRERRVYSRC